MSKQYDVTESQITRNRLMLCSKAWISGTRGRDRKQASNFSPGMQSSLA